MESSILGGLTECEGKTIRAVIDYGLDNYALLCFTDDSYCLLRLAQHGAVGDLSDLIRGVIGDKQLEASCPGLYAEVLAFREKQNLAIKLKREQSELEQYLRLKAKFEKGE